MKLTLSRFELKTIVAKHFNIPVADFTLSISDKGPLGNIHPKIVRFIDTVEKMDHNYTDKIAAIKLTRETFNLSLVDSKHLIEHWNPAKAFMLTYGKVPIILSNGMISGNGVDVS